MNKNKNLRIAFYMRVSKNGRTCINCDQTTRKRIDACQKCGGELVDEQAIENQLLALRKLADLEEWLPENITVFQDDGFTGSVGREGRPGFDELLNRASRKQFDLVAAWSLDRLGREPKDLFELAAMGSRKGFNLYLHKDRLDTSTATGEMLFGILACVAKFELRRTKERIYDGLERAKAQGKILGRPLLQNPEMSEQIHSLRSQGKGIKTIAKTVGCSVGKVYDVLKQEETA